jgi:hypothetical protein
VDRDERISVVLVGVISLLGLVALVAVPAAFLGSEPLEEVSDLALQIMAVFIALWSLKARRRMNELLEAESGDRTRFGWLPSLFFTLLYFNIKVNGIAGSVGRRSGSSPAGESPDARPERRADERP